MSMVQEARRSGTSGRDIVAANGALAGPTGAPEEARGVGRAHCRTSAAEAASPFAGMLAGFPERPRSLARRRAGVSNAPLVEIEFGGADEGYLRLHERRPVDFSAGKRLLIFGVAGAFAARPTAKIRHYARLAEQLGDALIDEVWCVAIHDPFIVGLWGVDLLPAPRFRLLCDATGQWTAASGLADPGSLGGRRIAAVEYSLLTLNGAVERVACHEN